MLVHDIQSAIGEAEGGDQAPHGNAFNLAVLSGGLTGFVVNLPGETAAFFPAHAFSPDEEGLALCIGRDSGVLPVFAAAGSTDWRRYLSRGWVDASIVGLFLGFPSGQHARRAK